MTREEAIQILADLTDNLFLHTWEEQYKALHMAIEALSADAEKPCKTCGYYNLKCPKDCEHNKGGGTE